MSRPMYLGQHMEILVVTTKYGTTTLNLVAIISNKADNKMLLTCLSGMQGSHQSKPTGLVLERRFENTKSHSELERISLKANQ